MIKTQKDFAVFPHIAPRVLDRIVAPVNVGQGGPFAPACIPQVGHGRLDLEWVYGFEMQNKRLNALELYRRRQTEAECVRPLANQEATLLSLGRGLLVRECQLPCEETRGENNPPVLLNEFRSQLHNIEGVGFYFGGFFSGGVLIEDGGVV